MPEKPLSLTLDIVFKTFFIQNPYLLRHFVSAMLDIPYSQIKDLQLVNTEIPAEFVTSKCIRLDLCLILDNKSIDIEIQVKKYNDFKDRILFYWAKLFTLQLKSGEDYSKLNAAISMSIVDFVLFDERSDYQTDIVPTIKGSNIVYSEKMLIRFYELKKVELKNNASKATTLSKKELWLQLLKVKTWEELKMLKESNIEEIEKACDVYTEMCNDKKLMFQAFLREKALHDEASALHDAKQEGKAEERNRAIEILRELGHSEEEIERFYPSFPTG